VRRLTLFLVIGLAIACSGAAVGQGVSESLEREARSAFRSGRFRDAAAKFQDSAASAAETARRGKMELQAAWSFFNDRNPKVAREAVRRALTADPSIEVVPEFFSPDFLRLIDEVRAALRTSQTPVPPPVDLAELKRVSEEKLRDGHAAEVVYDLTNLPTGQLDKEGWALLARAYDAAGRPADAVDARRRAGLPPPTPAPGPSETAAVPPRPFPTPVPSPLPVPGERPSGPMAEILAGGRASLQRGDAFLAQSAANRAIELEPNSSEAYRLLGDSYAVRGEKVLAEANWKQSLKLNEGNEATLLSLADFQLAERNWASAIAYLAKAVALNPANAGRLAAVGRKARAGGDLAGAANVFAALVKASPDNGSLLTEYGAILVEAGQVDQALDPLMQAAAVLPGSAIVRANLAGLLRRKGLRREAEREYREALRIAPAYAPALAGFAALLVETGRAPEAASLFEKLLQADPRNAPALIGLARARRTSDGPAAAAAVLDQAGAIDDPDVWNEAGTVAYDRKRYPEAVTMFDRALAKRPESALFRSNREKAAAAAEFLAATGVDLPRD
jgi:tetratricopeptide (TPR) repeat protein